MAVLEPSQYLNEMEGHSAFASLFFTWLLPAFAGYAVLFLLCQYVGIEHLRALFSWFFDLLCGIIDCCGSAIMATWNFLGMSVTVFLRGLTILTIDFVLVYFWVLLMDFVLAVISLLAMYELVVWLWSFVDISGSIAKWMGLLIILFIAACFLSAFVRSLPIILCRLVRSIGSKYLVVRKWLEGQLRRLLGAPEDIKAKVIPLLNTIPPPEDITPAITNAAAASLLQAVQFTPPHIETAPVSPTPVAEGGQLVPAELAEEPILVRERRAPLFDYGTPRGSRIVSYYHNTIGLDSESVTDSDSDEELVEVDVSASTTIDQHFEQDEEDNRSDDGRLLALTATSAPASGSTEAQMDDCGEITDKLRADIASGINSDTDSEVVEDKAGDSSLVTTACSGCNHHITNNYVTNNYTTNNYITNNTYQLGSLPITAEDLPAVLDLIKNKGSSSAPEILKKAASAKTEATVNESEPKRENEELEETNGNEESLDAANPITSKNSEEAVAGHSDDVADTPAEYNSNTTDIKSEAGLTTTSSHASTASDSVVNSLTSPHSDDVKSEGGLATTSSHASTLDDSAVNSTTNTLSDDVKSESGLTTSSHASTSDDSAVNSTINPLSDGVKSEGGLTNSSHASTPDDSAVNSTINLLSDGVKSEGGLTTRCRPPRKTTATTGPCSTMTSRM